VFAGGMRKNLIYGGEKFLSLSALSRQIKLAKITQKQNKALLYSLWYKYSHKIRINNVNLFKVQVYKGI
jgi:hypothetical protein